MDSIVHSAIEVICSRGVNGLPIKDLWPELHSPLSSHGLQLCPSVKKSLWANLVQVPGLQFQSHSLESHSPSVLSLEECESRGLTIIAPEHLRNCFVGIYDVKASEAGISQPQRRVLERLAIARTNGITQNELAKEFGIKGNNIFYILRNLESRGLIVRHSTILRKKEYCNDVETKSSSIVTTNMLHLYRYAKHLGCQQRLEITKEDKVNKINIDGTTMSDDGFIPKCGKDDVQIKDFLPALKAICDKLEKADGKVLLVSDIKQDLDYRGTSGHRAWRNICNRLKDALVVEEFSATVNKKEVSCLRLLKKFSPKIFETKATGSGYNDLDAEHSQKLGKRGRIHEYIVELPLEQQVYDMIDTEGSKGLTITEVCKRLGISNKRHYTRLLNMFSRFGMHLRAECYNKCIAYRVWTSRNFNAESNNALSSNPENILNETGGHNLDVGYLDYYEKSAPSSEGSDGLVCQSEDLAIKGHKIIPNESKHCRGLSSHELGLVTTNAPVIVASQEISTLALASTPPRRRSYQTYPCLSLSATNAQREQRILEILQDKKFLIKAELHRHLESLEKDKHTVMARKTLDRCLNKLQQEGSCKCIRVCVPVITNCGRTRTTDVVLHPTLSNVSPDLLSKIHERLRSFEIQLRRHSLSHMRHGQPSPVLNGVQRLLKSNNSDTQTEKTEAMRANGFVLAKMVRTKLLHIYLWGCLNSSPVSKNALVSDEHSYGLMNPHSSCKLFDVHAAVKAMPLELFLQVVGSLQKFDDVIEKCRKQMCLSGLPSEEYNSLMNTRAIARLSWLVETLRRLKLIRLVSSEHKGDGAGISNATLTYALELKPYIEEPVSLNASFSCPFYSDLRPQIRHDFLLSSRKAVDEYWNTLEYCYSAADSKAALHAFPGSSVHEVFFGKSWSSVRVMTAEQRAELLKRVMNGGSNRKLSFKDCENIAKDLNLTLEQVLRVYYDKRQRHVNIVKGAVNSQGEDFQPSKHRLASGKRKRLSERWSLDHGNVDQIDGLAAKQTLESLSDTDDQYREEICDTSVESKKRSRRHSFANLRGTVEEPKSDEQDEEDDFSTQKCALSSHRSASHNRFSWTERADRQLVIEYVRHRAALGANFHHTDWASLPNLPAPPNTCKRRMAVLNSSIQFRKSIMRLCNMLGKRYAMYLDKFQNRSSRHDECSFMVREHHFVEAHDKNLSDGPDCDVGFDPGEQWDNFDEKNIKAGLDELLLNKPKAKTRSSREVGSISDKYSALDRHAAYNFSETKIVSSISAKKDQHEVTGNKDSRKRLSCHHLPRKYVKLLNTGSDMTRRAYKSLAVSNAAELFELIFLSNSTAPRVANLLAETLKRYSEHDLFAAFNYLREKKVMIGGNGSSPFALSQQFFQHLSSSPFPISTGRRASKFVGWLSDRQKQLMEEGVELPPDLHCGDVLQLFALVSSEEWSITPCLPDEGIGEAEDSRTSKRKCDNTESSNEVKTKKLKILLAGEGEINSRREKGFPGISLFLSRSAISVADAVEVFNIVDNHTAKFGKSDGMNESLLKNGSNLPNPDPLNKINNYSRSFIPNVESSWEAMTLYAKHLVTSPSNMEQDNLLHTECFRNVYFAIQKTGDQGLTLDKVSEVAPVQGEKMAELIVEVLEAFGKVIKVNAYDCVHFVDSLYQSKYYLTSVADVHRLRKVFQPKDSRVVIDDERKVLQKEHHGDDYHLVKENNIDEVHKVTILNLPEQVEQPSSEVECSKASEDTDKLEIEFCYADSVSCKAILPWINGDGTTNEIVYKGLVRRLLGIVMQNPGILEDGILSQMHVLNPQSCRKLLDLMILDSHIIVRKMHQRTSGAPPSILGSLAGSCFRKTESVCRQHFFANLDSASLL